jgi:hypothetical protein
MGAGSLHHRPGPLVGQPMNRPGAIVIGPYRVTIVSDRKTDKVLDDLDRRGDSDLTRCVIRLHTELSDEAWAETLCHETLHFVYHLAGLSELDKPTEEQTVALMSPWLRMLGFLDGMLASAAGTVPRHAPPAVGDDGYA